MNKNLKNHYQNVIIYDLITKLHFKNIFEIPKITKICLNIGFKNANFEKKFSKGIPLTGKAKQSIVSVIFHPNL